MLKNLQAEIARSEITVEEIADAIHVSIRTVHYKIKCVTEFQRDEMFTIRDTFFPKLGVEYLFINEQP